MAKTETKTTKKTAEKVEAEVKTAQPKASGLSVPVYSLSGKDQGVLELPKEIFGNPINISLLAQALRVYTNNLKAHWSNTKTRGEVSASNAKIYRQKGTGGARHGSKKAPIFVRSGGIALGPKFRKTVLDLPKKMKKAALYSALAQKVKDEEVLAVSDLAKAQGKTREIAAFLSKVSKNSALIVAEDSLENVKRAVSNLEKVHFLPVNELNAYEVIKHHSLILTQQSVEKLQSGLNGKKTEDKVESKEVVKDEKLKKGAKKAVK